MYSDLYTAKELAILDKIDEWIRCGDADSSKRLPVKQSEIKATFSPWSTLQSVDFLRTREFNVLFTRTLDENDPDEPYYFFVMPNEDLIWPHGNAQCPHCTKPGKTSEASTSFGYYSIPRRIDDIPFHGKRTRITVIYPRHRCKICNRTFRAPITTFCEDDEPLSNRHIKNIRSASISKRSFESVAYEMCVDDETVRKYFRIEVDSRKTDYFFETPEHIGIDESKVRTSDGSRFYVVVLNTGTDDPDKNGIIEMDDVSRDTESIVKIFEQFENPEAIKTITMDMCKPYRAAAEIALPNARIIVDRFHLVQSLNKKVTDVVKSLYAQIKDSIERDLGIEPLPSEFDPVLSEYAEDDDAIRGETNESMTLPFNISEMGKAHIVPKDLPKDVYLKMRLSILKDGCRCKWFTMNPEKLSPASSARFFALLVNFPEFENLYRMKEMLRYDFFMAPNADAARAIASKAKSMLPSGSAYSRMRTYFGTLEGEEWSKHIYAYFEDPIGERYTNAALEGFNKIVKEINAAARGLSWHELKAKLLYGDLSTPHRKRRYSRKSSVSKSLGRVMSYLDSMLHSPEDKVTPPTMDDWMVTLEIPAVKEHIYTWGTPVQDTDEAVQQIMSNSNKCGLLYSLLRRTQEPLDADISDTKKENPVILPLRFSDWNAHKEQYLEMIASDARFLDRLKYVP